MDLEKITKKLGFLESGDSQDKLGFIILSINLFIYQIRPQGFPGLGLFGTIKIPLLFVIITTIASLPKFAKSKSRIRTVMFFFLTFEIVRGILGYFAPNDAIVRNDAKQMFTWLELFMEIISLTIPLHIYFQYRKPLGSLQNMLISFGAILSLFAMTHAGHGPGGNLGDENDLCLFLVLFLPFSIFAFFFSKKPNKKAFALICAIITLAGIVSTKSRGGFLGLLAVIFYFFLKSKKKLIISVIGGILIALAIPFVPADYVQEVKSIPEELMSEGGTIKERLDSWSIITNMWLDPRNTLFGTGLNNGPWNMQLYEPAERGYSIKSLAGRQAHSLYFQILGDLGAYGVILFSYLFFSCIRNNNKTIKKIKKENFKLKEISKKALESNNKTLLGISRHLKNNLEYTDNYLRMTNVSWIGSLVAAVGISVLYYPAFWLLIGISLAVQTHAKYLLHILDETHEAVNAEQL